MLTTLELKSQHTGKFCAAGGQGRRARPGGSSRAGRRSGREAYAGGCPANVVLQARGLAVAGVQLHALYLLAAVWEEAALQTVQRAVLLHAVLVKELRAPRASGGASPDCDAGAASGGRGQGADAGVARTFSFAGQRERDEGMTVPSA